MRKFRTTLTSLLLLAAMLLSAFTLTACGDDEEFFFLDENMSDYISIKPEDYKGVSLTVPGIAEIDPVADVKSYIVNAIAQYQAQNKKTETKTVATITEGDNVNIWYRGQVNMAAEGEPENWVDFIGGCNFYVEYTETTQDDNRGLVIGSGGFIKGFEEKLKGLEISDSSLKTASDSNKQIGMEGYLPIAYIQYTYEYKDASGNTKKGMMVDRIDLTKDAEGHYVDKGRYSDALREALEGHLVGEVVKDGTSPKKFTENFDITGDLVPEAVNIRNVQVKEIVKEERALPYVVAEGETAPAVTPDYTFELAFPNPYTNNKELAGKTARWYVYADSLERAVTEDIKEDALTYKQVVDVLGITFDMVKKGLLLTPDEQNATEGSGTDAAKEAAVLAHYREYIAKGLEEQRAATLKENTINTLWEHIISKVEVLEWPEGYIESYVDTLRTEAENEYAQYVQTYGSSVYPTLADYVANFYSDKYFPNTASVDAGFRKMAEEQLKQEMAIHYIAAAEGLAMTEREQEKYYEEQMQSMLDYYNAYYANDIAAGNVKTFTEADLANYGYTKQSIVSNYYYEKVSLKLYDTVKDKVTYDLSMTAEDTAK